MGQAWKIINIDKKEQIDSLPYKLMEWSYFGTANTSILINLLIRGKWRGDEIAVVGDYTERKLGGESLYDASESWVNLFDDKRRFTERYRYIYNHAKREFVDCNKCRVNYGYIIHPLPLLLAGRENGDGGGDYRGANIDYVGRWIDDSQSLEISQLPLFGTQGYKEIVPDFYEE